MILWRTAAAEQSYCLRETGDRYDNEERHLRFDGIFRWFRVLGSLCEMPTEPSRVGVSCISTSDKRKRAEEALGESKHESRLIVEAIPGLVAMSTPDGEVDVVNQQLVEYCGQPLEAMKQ
jgi:PAS domain-containing protein